MFTESFITSEGTTVNHPGCSTVQLFLELFMCTVHYDHNRILPVDYLESTESIFAHCCLFFRLKTFKILSMNEVMCTSLCMYLVLLCLTNKYSPINFHKCNQYGLLKRWKPLLREMALKIRLVPIHNWTGACINNKTRMQRRFKPNYKEGNCPTYKYINVRKYIPERMTHK